jgi:hypothetical protein
MANKKISEFPSVTTLSNSDVFLINSSGTTSTTSFDKIKNTITTPITSDIENLSSNFIKKPSSANNGQVLTYDGSTSTWVASAAPGTNNFLLSSNGWTRLPNGLIMQWGKYPSSSSGWYVKFPINFLNEIFNVQVTVIAGDGKRSAGVDNSPAPTLSGFTYKSGEGGVGDQKMSIYWTAIGY